jgi:hypothetical protein
MTYVNASGHPITLASGAPLAFGEPGEPDLNDRHDKALVDDGLLIQADEPGDYDSRHVDDLAGEVAARGLDVKGTGKDGNVLKADLVKALEDNDKETTK